LAASLVADQPRRFRLAGAVSSLGAVSCVSVRAAARAFPFALAAPLISVCLGHAALRDRLDSTTLENSPASFTGIFLEKIPLTGEVSLRAQKPENIRPTTPEERRDLKMLTQRAIRNVGGSNFANDTRVVESKLSEYGNPAHEKQFMPIDVVADLERVLGYPIITEHLAQLQGFRLTTDAATADEPDMEDVGAFSDTQGKLLSMLIRYAPDGYDHRERREILPVAEALLVQLQDLIKGLKGAPL
jgi:hypothetical protein